MADKERKKESAVATIQSAKKDKPEELDDGFERFMQVTDTTDLVAMILKTHLLAEYYIDQLILIHIKRGDIIINGRFSFSSKLKIIRALDILLDKDLNAIEGLNSLRNGCSHVLDYKIGVSDIDKIGLPYGVEYLKSKDKLSKDVSKFLHFTLMRIIARLDMKRDSDLENHKKKGV